MKRTKTVFIGILAAVFAMALTACPDPTGNNDGTPGSGGGITEQLAFRFDSELGGYVVTGRGTVTGSVIVIPDTHNGQPVRGIGHFSSTC